jgi:hypothetical protein
MKRGALLTHAKQRTVTDLYACACPQQHAGVNTTSQLNITPILWIPFSKGKIKAIPKHRVTKVYTGRDGKASRVQDIGSRWR